MTSYAYDVIWREKRRRFLEANDNYSRNDIVFVPVRPPVSFSQICIIRHTHSCDGEGVPGLAGWALFPAGLRDQRFFFGGMAGFELLAGCDITNLFWRDGGISVFFFRRDGGIGTRSGMQYFQFLRGSLIISYLVYKDNSIQRFSGEELFSNVSSVCVRPSVRNTFLTNL